MRALQMCCILNSFEALRRGDLLRDNDVSSDYSAALKNQMFWDCLILEVTRRRKPEVLDLHNEVSLSVTVFSQLQVQNS